MADSVGSGFPKSGIQRGHVFYDIDVSVLFVYHGGDTQDPTNWSIIGGVSRYRSMNAPIVLPDGPSGATVVTSVVYTGLPLTDAAICGSAEIQIVGGLGASLIWFQVMVQRLGRGKSFAKFQELDAPQLGFHKVGGSIVENLITGDVIQCVMGYEPTPSGILVANGFGVVVS